MCIAGSRLEHWLQHWPDQLTAQEDGPFYIFKVESADAASESWGVAFLATALFVKPRAK